MQELLTQVTQKKLSTYKFQEMRIKKILEYVERRSRPGITNEEDDSQNLTEEQEKWVKVRMDGPEWSWFGYKWNRPGEELNPHNSYGNRRLL